MRKSEFLRGFELLCAGAHPHYLHSLRGMTHVDCVSGQPQCFLSWVLYDGLLTVLTRLAPIPYDQEENMDSKILEKYHCA